MRQLPDPGTYQARLTGQIVVRLEESGALMAYIPYALVGASMAFSDNHSLCLGAKDGTLQKNNIKSLKRAFPEWDHIDMFALEAIPVNEDGSAQFELADCFHEDYDKDGETRQSFKAQWFNPLGGSLPTKAPMTADERKKAAAKFGGKFKAIAAEIAAAASGTAAPETAAAPPAGKPAPPAAKGKTAAPTAPAARKSTGAVARSSSQEEVWNALYAREKEAGKNDDEISTIYWDVLEEIAPGKQGDLTPNQWGAAADKFGV